MQTDLLALGAGAAGLMAAFAASRRGLSVTVLESGQSPGRKLAASGGGRANFGNRHLDASHYLCGSGPDFCRPALETFNADALPAFLAKWNLPWEERNMGRRFLKVPANKLVGALTAECVAYGSRFVFDHKADQIEKCTIGYRVFAKGAIFEAKSLLLACGSPAAPGLGGIQDGLALAKSLGHSIVPPAPALSPLLWQAEDQKTYSVLAGIGLPVAIAVIDRRNNTEIAKFTDDALFTHKGLSGPAALNASLYWRRGLSVKIDFLPGRNFEDLLDAGEKANRTPRALLKDLLPQKLADALLPENLSRKKIAQISRKDRKLMTNCVQAVVFDPKGVAGMQNAEICRGGVATAQLDPRTFASRLHPNLYIVGEMTDVAGELGGYNLHWAFASAYCAGQAIA